jgi:hypothetical protein
MLDTLSPHHLIMLRDESGISDEVIQARGYRTVTGPKQLEALGFSPAQRRVPGLLLPLWTTDGHNSLYVYRPDNPRVLEEKRKGKRPDGTYPNKVIKYEVPKGMGTRVDCPPACRPMLANPRIPLWITEGHASTRSGAGEPVYRRAPHSHTRPLPGQRGPAGLRDLAPRPAPIDR